MADVYHMHKGNERLATPLCGSGADNDWVVDEPERTNCKACLRLMAMKHNHITRDIKMDGSCPACTNYLTSDHS